MQAVFKSFLNTTTKTFRGGSTTRRGQSLCTGIYKDALRNVALNPVSLPLHFDEKECVITAWNLCVPTVDDIRESVHSWSDSISNRIVSYDYALIITSGLHRTRLIWSTVRQSTATETSTSSTGAASKLSDAGSVDELNEKWAMVKQKLPAWQNNIATQLQRLQDYINKKIKDVNVDSKKDC